jgi:hypothetical protein
MNVTKKGELSLFNPPFLVAKNPHFVYRNFRRSSAKNKKNTILWRCPMPTIECEGMQIELDDEGYLADFEKWI